MTKRKRSSHTDPGPWPAVVKVGGVILIIAAILSLSWFLAQMGPRRINYDQADYQYNLAIPKAVLAMLDESNELEKEFREAEKMRDITPEDLAKLRQAINLQQEYITRTGHDITKGNDRLDDLNTILQTYETDPIHQNSLDLEDKATAEEDAGHDQAAATLLTQAMTLQGQINDNYPLSKNRDFDRVASLQHEINFLTAEPLSEESHQNEAAARDALTHKDWNTAQADFQKAYDLQVQLNHDFTDQRFIDVAREESLNQELVSLRSTGTHRRVEELLAKAHAAEAQGDTLGAADALQEALRAQRDLVQNFPDSLFADPALVESIETELQTAMSRPVADEITRQAAELSATLRQRQVEQARDTVAILYGKAQAFRNTYPRSPLLEGDLEQRLEYLNFKRNDLASLQEQVYQLLAPVPNQTRYSLLKEEVPQELYQTVVGGNPSRNQGPKLPVDSVNWVEAKEFCHHLEWLLARPVRLPTEEEYRAAVGNTSTLDVPAMTWNMDNSGGHTQPVATKAANPAGFYDLLGNVAEWLEQPPNSDSDQAPVVGGNAETPVDSIRDLTVTEIAAHDRSRFTGFRFVVDLDPSAPLTEPSAPAPAPTPDNSAAALSGNDTAAPTSAGDASPSATGNTTEVAP
jgi:hypothetical protein